MIISVVFSRRVAEGSGVFKGNCVSSFSTVFAWLPAHAHTRKHCVPLWVLNNILLGHVAKKRGGRRIFSTVLTYRQDINRDGVKMWAHFELRFFRTWYSYSKTLKVWKNKWRWSRPWNFWKCGWGRGSQFRKWVFGALGLKNKKMPHLKTKYTN
jgi:hypothetical protein